MIQPVESAAQMAQELVYLEHQISLLQLEASMLAAELGAASSRTPATTAQPTGCVSTATSPTRWRANRIKVGEQVHRLPMSVDYLRDGEIGYAHLAVMARTAAAVGEVFDERQLLGLALEHTPGKLYFKSLHYRHSVDARKYAEEQSEHEFNHRISLSTAEDGCLLINGVLDPVGDAAVRAVLEPLAQRSGEHDHRLLPQRNADAVVEAITGDKPVNLQVTATIETLKGLAGASGGEMEFSLPLSSASMQRMACDCSITRVLLNQEPVTIDVGRSKRIMSGGLRRALRARDGHCRWPGCERAASLCQGHHLVHWIDGGETALGNLVLLCSRHHRLVHEGGWQIVRCEDGRVVTVAPTVTFGSHPRAPDG